MIITLDNPREISKELKKLDSNIKTTLNKFRSKAQYTYYGSDYNQETYSIHSLNNIILVNFYKRYDRYGIYLNIVVSIFIKQNSELFDVQFISSLEELEELLERLS